MAKHNISRLVLGTAQLGMPYGIANTTGRPDGRIAEKIVKEAWASGIREFDTAQGYGDSEKVLGRIFAKSGIARNVRVVSKVDPCIDHGNKKNLFAAVDRSLKRLGVPVLYGILLHDEKLLDRWDEIGVHFKDLRRTGRVKKLGVSVYSVEKGMAALQIPDIDVIQVPGNIWDRRFEKAGFFKAALKNQKIVYLRSVFLQGLVLMEPENIPPHLSKAKKYSRQLAQLCLAHGLTARDIALKYVHLQMPEAKIVLGVETLEQLKDNILSWNKRHSADVGGLVRKVFSDVPETIINPLHWKS